MLWRSWLPVRESKGVFSEIDPLPWELRTDLDAELEAGDAEGPGDDCEAWSPDRNPPAMMDTEPLLKTKNLLTLIILIPPNYKTKMAT